MIGQLHALTGGGIPFWRYLTLVGIAAVTQGAAIVLLFPTLSTLFGLTPAAAWPWVAAEVGVIALAWGVEMVAAQDGLTLGIRVMRVIQDRVPPTILALPPGPTHHHRVVALRRLVSSGAVEATSGVILLVTPVLSAWLMVVAVGLGLTLVHPMIGVVTTVAAFGALGAMLLSMRLQEGAEHAYEMATQALDDRLFEFAWAQPSLRTARHLEAGAALVHQAITATQRLALRLLWWQIPNELIFSVVLQGALLAIGTTTWMAYQSHTLTGVEAAVMILVALRVIEQITTLSLSTTALISVQNTLNQTTSLVTPGPPASPVLADAIAPQAFEPSGPRTSPSLGAPPQLVLDQVGVTFLTDEGDAAALTNIQATLEPGTITVIVGPSGSGKTTLGRVLAGLQAPTHGQVLWNGQTVSPATLRALTAMVFQQTHLNGAGIRANLEAANADLSPAAQDTIAEMASLRPILESLPQGWTHPIGELGTQLSGGEHQRVGMARALAKTAGVLVIDEASAALDTQHEQAMVAMLQQVRHRYTTLVITHRPAAAAIADQILVLDHGQLVESGSPAELATAGGTYTTLLRQWKASATWQAAPSTAGQHHDAPAIPLAGQPDEMPAD